MRIFELFLRVFYFLRFKLNNPNVPILRDVKLGKYYSQHSQDLYASAILFPYLKDFSGGYVIDIGCNHPERFSNSFFFEKFFKCKTIAIDPIEEYREHWQKLRPNATFIAAALGRSSGAVTLSIPIQSDIYDDMFSTVSENNPKIGKAKCMQREVQCLTLESILAAHQISSVEFVSIDVEGFELEVLEGINFERVFIKCFMIENNTKNLFGSEDIRKFLKGKGYIFYSRIGYLDDVFLHNTLI